MPATRRTIAINGALALVFALLALECVWFLVHDRFNIDEGMHLNAGRLLFERGLLPYRDFPFSQGPGGPVLYGAAGALFHPSLAVGRSFSLVLNLASVAAMVVFARRIGGAAAGFLVLAWTMVNLPAVWAYTQVRTEALAIPLIALAAMALCFRRETALQWALAPSLLVWATAIRLTNGLALAAVCVLVAVELRRSPRLLFETAGIVALNGIVAALPLLAFPGESFFHIVDAQLGRTERFQMTDYPFSTRFWFFVDRHTTFQPLLTLALIPLFVLVREWRRGWRPAGPSIDDPASVIAALWILAVLTYAPHVLFRIGFFSYFIAASVLLTLAVAIAIPLLARTSGRRAVALYAAVAVCWLGAAWHGGEHIRKWTLPARSSIDRFTSLRSTLRELSPDRCTMLTFETHIALETGCDVLPGLEYSSFSFFPDLPADEAARHGVLNREALERSLASGRPEFVLLTDDAVLKIERRPTKADAPIRTLAGERRRLRAEKRAARKKDAKPPILDAMQGRYTLVSEERVPVGPVHRFWTTVYVYARTDLVERAARAAGD